MEIAEIVAKVVAAALLVYGTGVLFIELLDQ